MRRVDASLARTGQEHAMTTPDGRGGFVDRYQSTDFWLDARGWAMDAPRFMPAGAMRSWVEEATDTRDAALYLVPLLTWRP
jgi:hypothetical protein